MSYHIISVDTPQCHLSCSHGQLILESAQGSKSVAMEDVGALIITSRSCTMSKRFIIEACQHRIGLILCDCFKPAAIILPVNRMTNTGVIRHLAHLPTRLKQRLWEKTVSAKCHNQQALCREWSASEEDIQQMQVLSTGRKPSRESECARIFWRVFAAVHVEGRFVRGRSEAGYNALFNYAYAILLSCMLQHLLALGLDPSFGIFHKERPHTTPLAYDLMEPLRPIFDANVSRWILKRRADGCSPEEIEVISPAYREHIAATLLAKTLYKGKCHHVRRVISEMVSSFRAAVLALETSPYIPWTYSTITWAG